MKNKMTIEILQERLKWTLEQKIDHAVGAIEDFISKSGREPYISFSGGKDSTVLLDLARRFVDKDMVAVFCNTGNEYPEIVKFVRTFDNVDILRPKQTMKQIIEENGFPLVSKEQALYLNEARYSKSEKLVHKRLYGEKKGTYVIGKISEKWKYLLDEEFDVHNKCCYVLKKSPFGIYERKTKRVPLIGTTTSESMLRRSRYITRGGCNSFNERRMQSHPISIFTEDDIFAYRDMFDLELASIYDIEGVDKTGCMMCGFGAHYKTDNRLEVLMELHPKAYDIFMRYENNGVTYREALRKAGVELPDEKTQIELF